MISDCCFKILGKRKKALPKIFLMSDFPFESVVVFLPSRIIIIGDHKRDQTFPERESRQQSTLGSM